MSAAQIKFTPNAIGTLGSHGRISARADFRSSTSVLAIALMVALSGGEAKADPGPITSTFTTAGVDTLWSNAANWSAGVPNGAGDEATINGTALTTGGPKTVGKLTLGTSTPRVSGAGTLTLDNGASAAEISATTSGLINPTSTVLAGATTVTGGTVTLASTVSGAGSLQVSNGAQLALTKANSYVGGTTIDAGGTLKISDGGSLGSGIVTNAGTLIGTDDLTITNDINMPASGASVLAAATGKTVTFDAEANVGNAAVLTTGAAGSDGTVKLASTASLTAAGTMSIEVAAGTLDASAVNNALYSSPALTGIKIDSGAKLAIGGGAATITNLTGSGTLTNGGATDATVTLKNSNFSGTLADGAKKIGVTVGSGSTVTLSGNNSYTGGTSVAGKLILASNNAAGGATGKITTTGSVINYANGVNVATPIQITSDTTQVEVLNADAAEQSGVISQDVAHPLEKIGSGTLKLSATNTYTGATTVTGGTLDVTGSVASTVVTVGTGAKLKVNGSSLGDTTAAVTLNGTGNLTLVASETIGSLASASGTSTVTLGANTLTTGGDNSSTTFAGVIDGAGGLTKTGSGTMTLSGANTYDGTTAVNGGTLVLSGGAAIKNSSAVSVGATGTLDLAASETVGALSGVAGATVNVNGNQLTTTGSATTTFAGNVKGTGNLSYEGTGKLTLTGANAITGVVGVGVSSIATGTLEIASGGTVAATTVGTSQGGTLILNGGALTAAGAGIVANGTVTVNGSETAGALAVTATTGSIAINGAATVLTVNGTPSSFIPSGASTISGNVTGSGKMNVTGGTTTVASTGNVTAATTVASGGAVVNNGGIGAVSNAGSFTNNKTAGAVTNTGGTGANASTGSMASLDVTGGTFDNAGAVTGNTTVATGTLNLNAGTNLSDLGSLTVTSGTVNVNAADTIGSLVANGGTTNVKANLTAGALSGSFGSIAITTPATLIAGSAGGNTSFSGSISGTGALKKVGSGTLTLNWGNDYSGGTTVSAGTLAVTGPSGTLKGANITIDPLATLTTDGGALTTATSITNNGTFALTAGGSESIANISNTGASNPGAIQLSSGSVLTLNTGTSTISGVVSGLGGLTVTGTSDTTLSAANSYTGTTTVNTGGKLTLQNGSAIADTGTVALAGGTLVVSNAETIGSLGGASGTVTLDASLTTGGNGGTTTFGGAIGGAGGLTKQGEGTMTLSGTNTYDGTTTVANGTLVLSSGTSAIKDTGIVSLTGDGNLTVASAETIGSLAGVLGTSLTLDANLTTGGNGGTTEMAGNISGAGLLTKTGAGKMTLSGSNSNTGIVEVNNGILVLKGGNAVADATRVNTTSPGVLQVDSNETIGSINGSGGVTLNANLTAGGNGFATEVSGAITGTGGLTKVGGGDLKLSGVNTYGGATAVNGGSLTIATTGSLTASTTTVATTGTLTNSGTVQGVINNGTFTNNALAFAGAVTNSATASNAGTVASVSNTGGTFTNTNTVTGNVGVTGGTFVNANAATVGGTATVGSGGTFKANGTSTVSGGLVNNGVVDMQNATIAGNVLNVTGALSGTGTYKLDANLSDAARTSGNTVDKINVGSVTDGSKLSFDFKVLAPSVDGADVKFFSSTAAFDSAAALGSVSGLTFFGTVTEQVVTLGDGYSLRTQANPTVSALSTNLSLTSLVLSNIINRPTSPFVRTGTLDERACRSGGFTRAVGGQATVNGSSTSSNGVKQSGEVSADYAGAQLSYDYGCYDGRFDGWTLVFGANLGLNNGSSDQTVYGVNSFGQQTTTAVGNIKTDFNQTYAGLYVTGRKGKVAGDVQVRFDSMKYNFSEAYSAGNEAYALGLAGQSTTSRAFTIGSRVSYSILLDADKGLSFAPSVGFSYTKSKGGQVDFVKGSDTSTLTLGDMESLVLIAGGTVSKSFVPADDAVTSSMFVSANVYDDVLGDRTSTLLASGTEYKIGNSGLGSFGEVSMGYNFSRDFASGGAGKPSQVFVTVRADARSGASVSNAYSLTAQVRLTF